MSEKPLIRVSPLPESNSTLVTLERPELSDGRVPRILQCTPEDTVFVSMDSPPADPPEAPVVRSAGQRLLEALSCQQAVRTALAMALEGEGTPIYVQTVAGGGEALPWEVLHADGMGFLCLEDRCPIARLADHPVTAERTFAPPLQIVAVLTALDVEGRGQWNALYDALRGSPVDFRLRVYVCERDLLEHIRKLDDERVNASFFESKTVFLEELDAQPPHILHFFCHGYAENGGYLQLASPSQYESGELGRNDLQPSELQRVSGVWLVVLNCCEGAAATGTPSFASRLASSKFAAVVGMRRAISVSDADTFARTFYKAALTQIAAATASDNEIEWVHALVPARRALCEQHPGPLSTKADRHSEWTLPVLYVASETMRLTPIVDVQDGPPEPDATLSASEVAYLRKAIETLNQAKLELPPDLPGSVRERIDERIAVFTSLLYPASSRRSPNGDR